MDTLRKISDIISMLDEALTDSDWNAVEDSVSELNFLYEELQSTCPFEYSELASDE